MRAPVAEWLLNRRLFPVCEVQTSHLCDMVGVRFETRCDRRIPRIEFAVAVELKLKDWKGVFFQCCLNQHFYGECWAVLPERTVRNAMGSTIAKFAGKGIGVGSLSDDGAVTVSVAPQQSEKRWPKLHEARLWRRATWADLTGHARLGGLVERPVDFGYQPVPTRGQ